MNKIKRMSVVFCVLAVICSRNLFGVGDFFQNNLHRAAQFGNCVLVRQCLSAGFDPNVRNCYGWNALHLAVFYHPKNIEMAQILLNAGVNVNAPVLFKNRHYHLDSPLHLAVRRRSCLMVEFLVLNGANMLAKNCDGFCPIYYAMYRGFQEIVQLFFEMTGVHNTVEFGSIIIPRSN